MAPLCSSGSSKVCSDVAKQGETNSGTYHLNICLRSPRTLRDGGPPFACVGALAKLSPKFCRRKTVLAETTGTKAHGI